MKNPQELVIELSDAIIELSNNGEKAKATKLIQNLYVVLQEFPQIIWNSPQVWKLAKSLLIMYHYDVVDDEDENITLAEHAYIYAQRSVELYENTLQEQAQEDYFSALHTQLVLLSTCEDCFLLTIEQLYSKTGNFSDEEHKIARALAREIIPLVQYSLIDKIEQEFDSLRNDPFLEQICNQIELEHPELTEEKIELGKKINGIMVKALVENF